MAPVLVDRDRQRFSHRTWNPRRAASTASGACRAGGVPMSTKSSDSRASRSTRRRRREPRQQRAASSQRAALESATADDLDVAALPPTPQVAVPTTLPKPSRAPRSGRHRRQAPARSISRRPRPGWPAVARLALGQDQRRIDAPRARSSHHQEARCRRGGRCPPSPAWTGAPSSCGPSPGPCDQQALAAHVAMNSLLLLQVAHRPSSSSFPTPRGVSTRLSSRIVFTVVSARWRRGGLPP